MINQAKQALALALALSVAAARTSCRRVTLKFAPVRSRGCAPPDPRACARNRSDASFARGCVFRYREPIAEDAWPPAPRPRGKGQISSSIPRRPGSPQVGFGRYARCAVVSGAGSLRGARCGKSVDAADAVFRAAPAPGA